VAGEWKTGSILYALIAECVASVFTVARSGHGIIVVQRTFSCMYFRSFGIFATMRSVLMKSILRRNLLMHKFA